MTDVRVRIAPSPTGNLHVGTARTALFNYMFAKGRQGTFILRIEDTDLERSESIYVQNIYDGLKALGLRWDEGPDCGGNYGPYLQSERVDIYKAWADKLLEKGHAYYCYLTEQELEQERQQAMEEKRPYVYSGKCRDIHYANALKAKEPWRTGALRLRIPENQPTLVVKDMIRGDIPFDPKLIGDFILMKSNGMPSYNFAVVVDDILMKITHVIRGEDHIPNTPRQLLLYQAFEETVPEFAHLGMILAPDRSKLSKRHGATAVSEFVQQGYFPEAFCNFLSLLGWSPPDTQEVATLAHFIQQFELERVVHSPAVFDQEKLNWMNGLYIRNASLEDLWQRAQPFLATTDLSSYSHETQLKMLEIVREPLVTLNELADALSYFQLTDTVSIEESILKDVLQTEDSQTVLKHFAESFLPLAEFVSAERLAEQVKTFANGLKPLKMKAIMWAVRAAITGRVHGADLSQTLFILGKPVVEQRVQTALTRSAQAV
jgi:nondiscriminating glutamyl-tRNA synthetase